MKITQRVEIPSWDYEMVIWEDNHALLVPGWEDFNEEEGYKKSSLSPSEEMEKKADLFDLEEAAYLFDLSEEEYRKNKLLLKEFASNLLKRRS
jgi:hypothetical protein